MLSADQLSIANTKKGSEPEHFSISSVDLHVSTTHITVYITEITLFVGVVTLPSTPNPTNIVKVL